MGSAEEFKKMIRFVAEHKIVPVIDTVLHGLDKANEGFVSDDLENCVRYADSIESLY